MGKQLTKKAKIPPSPASVTAHDEVKTHPSARIDLGRLAAMLAGLPPVSEAERAGFRSQFSDEKARALGATTRAAVVELEAMRFARPAYDYLLASNNRRVRYAPVRLAFLLECVAELADARAADVTARTKAAAKQGGRSLAESRAAAILGELSLSMQDVTVGSDDLSAQLASARKLAVPADDTAAALDALAQRLEGWLADSDPRLAALLAGYNLGAEDVTAARAAAAALRKERDAAQATGSAHHDGAAVNAIEGRVLFEMRLLRKLFHRASDRTGDPSIPRLNPSPGLRRVFSDGPTDAEGGPDSPAPTPPTP